MLSYCFMHIFSFFKPLDFLTPGLLVSPGGSAVISPHNLTFTTNSPEQDFDIRLEITSGPNYGKIQRQVEPQTILLYYSPLSTSPIHKSYPLVLSTSPIH